MITNKVIQGNCIDILKNIDSSVVELVYFDPPFFTQKTHSLANKDQKVFSFDDKYTSLEEYLSLIQEALEQSKRILKDTGSVFLHCDKTASHYLRTILDKVFGSNNFQSEIIWSYKRWSNAKKGLLNAHQVIFFYSKTKNFKFNTIYKSYAATTNIDQIMQERKRDKNGRSVYKRDKNGKPVLGKAKKGVPLSDVWEIPYLNPKARERTGYPTQKPVLLLNQILQIATNEGDLVIDPFCGSGTTCVAAKLLRRKYIGIDLSEDAVTLAKTRLEEMIISKSNVLQKGEDYYIGKSEKERAILQHINAFPVHRNSGIDGFLNANHCNIPVPVKIQAENETIDEAIDKLERASSGKNYGVKIVIQTKEESTGRLFNFPTEVTIIKSLSLQAKDVLQASGTPSVFQKSG